MKGIDRVDAARLFPLVRESRTSLKIRGSRFKTELRRNFFTQWVVNLWNSLPSEAVESPSLNILKKKIDSFLMNKGIKGYGVRPGKWS